MACYVEGCIVRHAGVMWMIRGTRHPRGALLALPRYALAQASVKEPHELIRMARRIAPQSVRYSLCYGRKVPLLSLGNVEGFLNPLDYCTLHEDKLACSLVEALREATGVEEIGVTGSRLARGPGGARGSDIDIMVYGGGAHRFYQALQHNPVLERYSRAQVEELSRQRGWPPPGPLLEREQGKVLQGLWRGADVYIRLVPQQPWDYRPCDQTVYYLGERLVEGTVTDASRGFLFPCTYEIDARETIGSRIKLTSPRGRFCETLREGDRVVAWGRLELVRPGYTGSPQLQLVLSETSHGIRIVGGGGPE